MYPILFTLPDFRDMALGAQIAEVVVGVGCALGWLALYLRGRRGTAASLLNLGAFLVLLHVALSVALGRDVTIYSFGVLIVLGFFAGAAWLLRETRRMGLEDRRIFDWAFWMLVIGIVGARLLHVYMNYDAYTVDKLGVFKIWQGGLVLYGGLVPALLAGLLLAWRWKLPVLRLADAGAAAFLLALGVGRWASFLAGDDYGAPTDLAWGVRFHDPASLVPGPLLGEPLHPTQLLMSVAALWLFFVVTRIRARARRAGTALAWMLVLYAVVRGGAIEPLRGDVVERNPSLARHVAVPLVFEKQAGTAPLSLPAGTAVRSEAGRGARLLEPVELAEGEDFSRLVHALSDRPDPDAPAIDPLARGGPVPAPPAPWRVASVEGVDDAVAVRALPPEWYRSHLPAPSGYVSTSQWLSLVVAALGAGLFAIVRRRDVPAHGAAGA